MKRIEVNNLRFDNIFFKLIMKNNNFKVNNKKP